MSFHQPSFLSFYFLPKPSGFKHKELRGKLAIGITTNFVNRNTAAEAQVAEISGVARIYNQKFFQDLLTETGREPRDFYDQLRWTEDVFIYTETAVCSISVSCLQAEAKKEEISRLSLIYFAPQLALGENMKNEVEPLNRNISNRTRARLFSFYCSPVVPSRT